MVSSGKKQFLEFLHEDLKLRQAILKKYPDAGISQVEIDRQSNRIAVTIHTSRPVSLSAAADSESMR